MGRLLVFGLAATGLLLAQPQHPEPTTTAFHPMHRTESGSSTERSARKVKGCAS
jgi:hypothetical protein